MPTRPKGGASALTIEELEAVLKVLNVTVLPSDDRAILSAIRKLENEQQKRSKTK